VGGCCLAAWASTARAQTVIDREHGFSFTLPREYRDFPEGRAAANVIQSFVRGQPGEASFALLRFDALRGTIGRDRLNRPTVERAGRAAARGSGVELIRFDYRK